MTESTAPDIEVTLLGTGGPRPDPDRQGPAVLVRVPGAQLLVDCGRGVCTRLAQAGASLTEIDAVLVTHLHFDHVSDLGDVIMAAWNLGRTSKLPIIGPPGLDTMVAALLNDVYNLDIRYRLSEGALMGHDVRPPHEMVDVCTVTDGHAWAQGAVSVEAGTVDHGDILDLEGWTALGYRIEAGDKVVTISGDAVPSEGLTSLARDADLLVMCCYLHETEIDSTAAATLSERIIGGAPQAIEVAAAAEVQTLVLTHIRQKSDHQLADLDAYVNSRFDGEVIVGHDLLVLAL